MSAVSEVLLKVAVILMMSIVPLVLLIIAIVKHLRNMNGSKAIRYSTFGIVLLFYAYAIWLAFFQNHVAELGAIYSFDWIGEISASNPIGGVCPSCLFIALFIPACFVLTFVMRSIDKYRFYVRNNGEKKCNAVWIAGPILSALTIIEMRFFLGIESNFGSVTQKGDTSGSIFFLSAFMILSFLIIIFAIFMDINPDDNSYYSSGSGGITLNDMSGDESWDSAFDVSDM